MSITPPTVSPVTVDFPSVVFRGQQDIQPFTYRSGMTYTQLLESIRAWLYNTLVPYLNTNFEDFASSWETNVQQIAADVQTAINNEDTAVDQAIVDATNAWANANLSVTDPAFLALINSATSQSRQAMDVLYGSTGVWHAPVPTGVAATDTANLLQAITTAQNNNYDLEFSVSPLGTVKNYALNQALSWDLTRGSFRGKGQVGLDFTFMPSNATGAAFTIKGSGSTAGYAHLAAMHKLSNFRMFGADSDTATLDGILVADASGGIDQGLVESVHVQGFRDNLTYGSNEWSITFFKCAFANAHRYGVNLSQGSNAGEATSLDHCSIYNSHNAAGNAAAIYVPSSGTEFRMIGGSLDYNDYEGVISGGELTFIGVHIEDNKTNPMFTYTGVTGGADVSVSFIGCAWDSSTVGTTRDHLHEILPSTRFATTITFTDDKGGVYDGACLRWLVDNSGDTSGLVRVAYRNYMVAMNNGSSGTVLQLGAGSSVLTNTGFDDSSAFVAANGLGWTTGSLATWTIGGGNARTGSCLKATGTGTAGVSNTTQRVRIDSARRPIRVSGYQAMQSWVAGSAGLYAQFYADDGVTAIGGGYRIGSDLSANSSYTGKSRVLVPPKGAAYVTVQCYINGLNGVAEWDDIEVVPV